MGIISLESNNNNNNKMHIKISIENLLATLVGHNKIIFIVIVLLVKNDFFKIKLDDRHIAYNKNNNNNPSKYRK